MKARMCRNMSSPTKPMGRMKQRRFFSHWD